MPFPFTDLTNTKRRPALIVSPDDYNRGPDVVIAFVTSNLNVRPRMGDYKIQEWNSAGLPKPSMIRMKFSTLDQSIIVKQVGRLSHEDQQDYQSELTLFFSG